MLSKLYKPNPLPLALQKEFSLVVWLASKVLRPQLELGTFFVLHEPVFACKSNYTTPSYMRAVHAPSPFRICCNRPRRSQLLDA